MEVRIRRGGGDVENIAADRGRGHVPSAATVRVDEAQVVGHTCHEIDREAGCESPRISCRTGEIYIAAGQIVITAGHVPADEIDRPCRDVPLEEGVVVVRGLTRIIEEEEVEKQRRLRGGGNRRERCKQDRKTGEKTNLHAPYTQ